MSSIQSKKERAAEWEEWNILGSGSYISSVYLVTLRWGEGQVVVNDGLER